MSFVIKNRVQETTVTTGTGTVTLLGATQQHQAFSAIGNANTTCYLILSGNGVDWEVGIGTYTLSGTTLSRTTILESSNSGSAVSLVGTSLVTCTNPAQQASANGLFDQMFGTTTGFVPTKQAGGTWAGAVPGGGGGGSLVLISTQTASSSAALTWTGLGSTYETYLLVLKQLVPVTDGSLFLIQIGEGAGPTWKTTGYASAAGDKNSTNGANSTTNTTGIVLSSLGVSNVAANGGANASIWCCNVTAAAYKSFHGTSASSFNTTPATYSGNTVIGVYNADQTAGTGIQLVTTSGNILSGKASLYGVAD